MSKYFVIIITLINLEIKAQDPMITQFYMFPEILNPAFTGISNGWSAGLLHRRQWPNGNTQSDTQFAYANNLISDEVALGITVMNHNELFTKYNYFKFNGVFAYILELDYDWRLRFGLEAGFGRKDFNFNSVLLEDQINPNTGTISPGSIDPGILDFNNKINFLDFTAGFAFDQENAWFGMAVRHLNRPDISFRENGNVPLNLFFTIHGGYFFELFHSPSTIIPQGSNIMLTANYMRQSQYNRLDVGAVFDTDIFSLGVIFATNPEGRSQQSPFLISVNPVASFKIGEFTFGYSHDFNATGLSRKQGIHEFTLVWQSSRQCGKCNNYKVKLKRGGGLQRSWF